ncbi:MAG: glycogen-binding domain-containing protein [Verrucomicrobiota bacterium]
MPEPSSSSPLSRPDRQQTYSKVFRWRLPDGHTDAPESVSIVGSFTHWQKVPMQRDSTTDAWHTTVHHIPGNKTHHYMILVDGKPANDKNSDGFAVPVGPQEEQYQLMTDRGPRVFMLFAQAK